MSVFQMLCALALVSSANSAYGDTIFDVTKYGAKGDGRTDDTQAFLKVFRMACNGGYASSPRIFIPSWGKFVVHPTNVPGPCKPKYMSIQGHHNNLRIWGKGGIDGDGPRLRRYMGKETREGSKFKNKDEDGQRKTWPSTKINAEERSTNVAFFGCNHLRIDGISTSYSERNHISISECEDVVISNIKIRSPSTSKNTDGIDISHSRWITIRDSNIQTGDDCIAINTGTFNVNITNVYCGPGHGISIGSFKRGEASVENVEVRHCTFTGTTNGARIKTFSDGIGGYVKRVTFQDITLQNVERPIIIDQFYHELVNNLPTGVGTYQVHGVVDINDVKFIGFRGTCSEDIAIFLNCRGGPGCNRIIMRDVNIKGSRGQPVRAECHNAHGTAQSVSPRVDCLSGHIIDNDNKEVFIDGVNNSFHGDMVNHNAGKLPRQFVAMTDA